MKQTIKQVPEILSKLPEEAKAKIKKVETEELFELRLTETPLFVIKIPEGFYVLPYGKKPEKTADKKSEKSDDKKSEKTADKKSEKSDDKKSEKLDDKKVGETNCEKVKYVLGHHECGNCANISNCPKVRDAFKDAAEKWCATNFEAVRDSKRSEKYPFVKKCVELVNAPEDFFVVAECANFKVGKNNQTEETHTDADQKWEQRAQLARQEMEEQRRIRLEGGQYYNFGYKPW